MTLNRTPVRDRPGHLGWRRGSQYCGRRITPVEGRGLSSRPRAEGEDSLEIGASLLTPLTGWETPEPSARAAVNQPTLTAEWEDRDYTGLVREPDGGNPPVRFDERGVETEYGHLTMPPRHTSTLLLILAASLFLLLGHAGRQARTVSGCWNSAFSRHF